MHLKNKSPITSVKTIAWKSAWLRSRKVTSKGTVFIAEHIWPIDLFTRTLAQERDLLQSMIGKTTTPAPSTALMVRRLEFRYSSFILSLGLRLVFRCTLRHLVAYHHEISDWWEIIVSKSCTEPIKFISIGIILSKVVARTTRGRTYQLRERHVQVSCPSLHRRSRSPPSRTVSPIELQTKDSLALTNSRSGVHLLENSREIHE